MNPFISFCLYVAARVFVQYLKSRPKDGQILMSLRFLLSAMHAIKRKNPLTESFLVQLDVDLESAGLEDSASLRAQMPKQSSKATKSPGSPQGQDGVSDSSCSGPPTYGDSGIAIYNQPDSDQVPKIPLVPRHVDPFTYSQHEVNGNFADFRPMQANAQYDLQNREQRTPGSTHTINGSSPGSNTYRSPVNNGDMDTSPDGSGGDNRSPESQQNQSSHTSNTDYSPATQDQRQRQQNANFTQSQSHFQSPQGHLQAAQAAYDPLDFSNLPIDYSTFSNPVLDSLPHTTAWQGATGGGNVGFTPGVSMGFTPGAGGITDLPNLSEAEWTAMLEASYDWDPKNLAGSVADGLPANGRR